MLLTYIFIYDRISHINRKDNMEDNKHFTITYYAKKHKKHISRQAKWIVFVDIGQVSKAIH